MLFGTFAVRDLDELVVTKKLLPPVACVAIVEAKAVDLHAKLSGESEETVLGHIALATKSEYLHNSWKTL